MAENSNQLDTLPPEDNPDDALAKANEDRSGPDELATEAGQIVQGIDPKSLDTRSRSVRIGNYKLLQKIADGGMGSVWMAEQEKPVRRRVAIKLIKSGMDSEQIVARFEAERQALAMMDHQNIAKILDAGTTDSGQPYFVMELVQGIPITKYCDQNRMGIDERLKLFIPICNAIQHAHQKGIIHRDLKPSNILVTQADGKPIPKVIDFGLAKALQHQTKLTDKTLFTEFGQVVGTLQYMSPEQAEMNTLDIDTRTDIYSLGVLLYELLTGSTPIDSDSVKDQAFLAILMTIREQDPPRPSDRLSSSKEKITGISAQRQIDPRKLTQILRGDLDWIVMKALDKVRSRRYETANGFAQDVQRFLSNEAIEARPPSTVYRLRKFVYKNRGLVTSITSIATLLLIGIWQSLAYAIELKLLTSVAVILLIGMAATTWFAIAAKLAQRQSAKSEANAISERKKAEESRKNADVAALRARESELIAQSEATHARNAEQSALEEASRAEAAEKKTAEQLARSNFFLALARWNDGRVDEANDLLYSIKKEHRRIEWNLLHRKFEGSDVTLYGHISSVTSVSFSPDGSQIVSGSTDKSIKCWDARTGAEIMTLIGHSDPVNSVSFSPDSSRIISGGGVFKHGEMKLWDARSGAELMAFKEHSANVTSVQFSPDGGRILSGSGDMTIRLWDARTGLLVMMLNGHSSEELRVAFSPDGTQIASASRDTTAIGSSEIKIWDARTGEELVKLNGSHKDVTSISFSPDGLRIVTGNRYGSSINLWDARTGEEMLTLKGPSSVYSVSFSPDGTWIVAGCNDSTIRLWDVRTGEELMAFRGHAGVIRNVSFNPDGSRIVSGSDDRTIKLWDVRTGREIVKLNGHADLVKTFGGSGVSLNSDGSRIASVSDDGTIRLWDAHSMSRIATLIGNGYGAQCVSFSPDDAQIVSVGRGGIINLWDAHTGAKEFTLKGHYSDFNCVSFSPDSKMIVSGSRERTVKVWDAHNGTELMTLKGHSGDVRSVCFSPDGSQIVSGGGSGHTGEIKLWDTRTGVERMTLNGRSRQINAVSFNANGSQIVSGSEHNLEQRGEIKLWDARTGVELMTLKAHRRGVFSALFCSDGDRIVSESNDGTTKIWDTRSGLELLTLNGRSLFADSVSVNREESRIDSGSNDGSIKFWEARSTVEIARLKGPPSYVAGVAISPDGFQIASAAEDNKILLRNARTGAELMKLNGHLKLVAGISFSPDGSRIVSWGIDNTVKLWDAQTGSELLTLTGLSSGNTNISFSSDGRSIVSRGNGERFAWNAQTGESIETPPNTPFIDRNRSFDGRWFAVHSESDVLLIDLQYQNDPIEREYREIKSRLDPYWHSNKAEAAERENNWYSAMFHWAWEMKTGDPHVLSDFRMRRCIATFLKHLQTTDSLQNSRLDIASDYKRFVRSDLIEKIDASHSKFVTAEDGIAILKMASRRVAELFDRSISAATREQRRIAGAQQGFINAGEVQLPFPSVLTEFDLLVLATEQHPNGDNLNTLGVAHYLRGEYQKAVDVLNRSMPLNTREHYQSSPLVQADTAFLALSYLKLGQNEEAKKYRAIFNKAMNLEKLKYNNWYRSFAQELEQAFAVRPETQIQP